eukprot:2442646-Pleurochrysis_carterae.AAC.4
MIERASHESLLTLQQVLHASDALIDSPPRARGRAALAPGDTPVHAASQSSARRTPFRARVDRHKP